MKNEFCAEQGSTNARLTKDFLQHAIKDPGFLKGLPKGTHIIFVPTDNKAVAIANLKMAIDLMDQGESVTLARWKPVPKKPATRVPQRLQAEAFVTLS